MNQAKNIINKGVSVLAIGLGLLFLFNSVTDIQIGFGAVLLTVGVLNLTK